MARAKNSGRSRLAQSATRRGSILSLLLAWGSGCTLVYGNELDKKQCKRQADCEATAAQLGTPLVCREQACQAPICSQTEDCPAGSVCSGNLCVASVEDAGVGQEACEQDNDCASAEQRCGYDGFCYEKWGCLDEDRSWPQASTAMTYVASLRRAEAPTDVAAVGSPRIDVCFFTDPSCMRPATNLDEIIVDENNRLTVSFMDKDVTQGFHGFVRINSTSDAFGSALPLYRHFVSETPLVTDFVEPTSLSAIGAQSVMVLSALYGIQVEPGTAIMQLNVSDCGGRPAGGVSITAPDAPEARFLAIAEGGPVQGAAETPPAGTGCLLNLPPNRQQLFVLRDEALQRTITDTFSFVVFGDALNVTAYYPRYSALQKWMEEAERQGLAPQH